MSIHNLDTLAADHYTESKMFLSKESEVSSIDYMAHYVQLSVL